MLSMHELSLSMPEPMLSLSMLTLANMLLLRWTSPFKIQIKTGIHKFQHVDFWVFWVELAILGQIFSAKTGGGKLN